MRMQNAQQSKDPTSSRSEGIVDATPDVVVKNSGGKKQKAIATTAGEKAKQRRITEGRKAAEKAQ